MPDDRYRLRSGALLTRLMAAADPEKVHTPQTLAVIAGLSVSKVHKLLQGVRPTLSARQAALIAEAVGAEKDALFAPSKSAFENEDEESPAMTPQERKLRAQLAAHTSWANTADPSTRTAKARRAHEDRFLARARELHPDAGEQRLAEVAASLKKAHFTRLGLASAKARRAKAKNAAA